MAKSSLFYILLLFLLIHFNSYSQHSYIPLGQSSMHILDRLEIKSGELNNDYFHSSNKSYRRKSIVEYLENLNDSNIQLTNRDKFNIDYLNTDNC